MRTPITRAAERRPEVEALRGMLIAAALSIPLWALMIGLALAML